MDVVIVFTLSFGIFYTTGLIVEEWVNTVLTD